MLRFYGISHMHILGLDSLTNVCSCFHAGTAMVSPNPVVEISRSWATTDVVLRVLTMDESPQIGSVIKVWGIPFRTFSRVRSESLQVLRIGLRPYSCSSKAWGTATWVWASSAESWQRKRASTESITSRRGKQGGGSIPANSIASCLIPYASKGASH